MQTELMLRLLREDRIVGYSYTFYEDLLDHEVETWYYADPQYAGQLSKIINRPDHDAFELGIKVGDEWWFEGDVGRDMSGYGDKFILKHNGIAFEMDYGDNVLNRYVWFANQLSPCERIGNIHDKDQP